MTDETMKERGNRTKGEQGRAQGHVRDMKKNTLDLYSQGLKDHLLLIIEHTAESLSSSEYFSMSSNCKFNLILTQNRKTYPYGP